MSYGGFNMKTYKFRIIGLIIAAVYWIVESVIHLIVFNDESFEIIPSKINELWMRSLIVIIILIFSSYVDSYIRKIREKEKEKVDIYNAMLKSCHHIINNFLNQMQIVKMEAEECEGFDKDILDEYDAISDEATSLIKKLESVPHLSAKNIMTSVLPK